MASMTSSPPVDVPATIRYRLIGARYELGQALRDALETNLATAWQVEVQRAQLAVARALAMMEKQQ